MIPAKRRQTSPQNEAPLLDAVFGDRRATSATSGRRSALLIGLVVALGAHAGLYLVARSQEPSLETWAANVAALVHADLANSAPTEIESTPVPEPESAASQPPIREPEPEPEPEPESRPEPNVAEWNEDRAPNAPADSEPAAPAQAGEILAAEEDLEGPVDFTDDAFITGSASAYVGGATTSTGTGNQASSPLAVERGGTGEGAKVGAPDDPSMSRPVRLPGSRWRCAWPKAALDQEIYEQFIVLRVHVRPDGSVHEVNVQSDPGDGFGAAAIACAKRTRFTPALDESGNPVAATSPPIRVRFTR